MGLLVAGSSDGKIRFFSPTQLAKPWMVLTGHEATIAAVSLQNDTTALWSLCDQSVLIKSGWTCATIAFTYLTVSQELRYWDLNQGKCVRIIRLEFTSNRKGRVQFSQRPLLTIDSRLYIACGDSVATVQFNQPSDERCGSKCQAGRRETSEESSGDAQQGAENKIPIRFREGLLDFGYRHEDDVFNGFLTDLKKVFAASSQTTERLSTLRSIEGDVGDLKPTYEWEKEVFGRPPPPTHLIPLNQLKLKELDGREHMKRHVREGTPFCGLRLVEPKRIELPSGLPVTDRMKKQGIEAFHTLEQVRTADFDLFSERMVSLSSQRSSLASSILSYYRQKNVGDRVAMAGDSEFTSQLHVSRSPSQSSSRNSSLVSLSPHSSGASMEGS